MEVNRGLITASRILTDPDPPCASLGRATGWTWNHVTEPALGELGDEIRRERTRRDG
jgi:hypothetical protein